MDYLNIRVSELASDGFLRASLEQRGAWIGLVRYCAVQENGGEIIRCQEWTDMQWMQACGVTTAIVKEPSPLWNWNGDCLRIFGYPYDQEQALKRKRQMGKKYAALRWDKKHAKRMQEKPAKLRVVEPPKAVKYGE